MALSNGSFAVPAGRTANAQSVTTDAHAQAATTDVIAIDSGGPATGTWVKDRDYSGKNTSTRTTNHPIITAGIANPAPQKVYQSQRIGPEALTYTIPGLVAGAAYTVLLHFAEIHINAAGKRLFNVSINGTRVLSNFDVFVASGGEFHAIVERFSASANQSGKLVIGFTPVVYNAIVNGIEVQNGISSAGLDALLAPTPPPTGIYEPSAPDVMLPSVVLPTPFDPASALSTLRQTSLPNEATALERNSGLQRFLARRLSTAPPGDHEAWGLFTDLNGLPGPFPYNAFYAAETGYEFAQGPLGYPVGVTGLEQIFAPTIRMGWSNLCLEDSTYYRDDNATDENAEFTVFNFCLPKASFIFATTINSTFVSTYEGRLPNGAQAYVVETFTPDVVPNGASTWYTLLYNFAQQRWDVISSVNAQGYTTVNSNAYGWNIAEPYFAAGTCPKLAPSGSAVVSFHNTGSGGWDQQASSMSGGLSVQIGIEAPVCFTADTQPATLQPLIQSVDYNWVVTSPQ